MRTKEICLSMMIKIIVAKIDNYLIAFSTFLFIESYNRILFLQFSFYKVFIF